ncbi:MAG: hypothetical protein HYU88_11530 [Chloroflexi bacterium]|nr:hypothetical protein [Chloroflexota bacterium]
MVDRERQVDLERAVQTVDGELLPIDAGRDAPDRRARGLLGLPLDRARQGCQVGQLVLVQELGHARSGEAIGGDLRFEVADHLVGHADVLANELEHEVGAPAGVEQLGHRDA